MAIGVEDAPSVQGTFVRPVTLGWFLKRLLIGLAILLIAMGGLAWLTYASIDPTIDAETASQPVGAIHEPQAQLTPIEL